MMLNPNHCTYEEYEAYLYATGEDDKVLAMMQELEPEPDVTGPDLAEIEELLKAALGELQC